MTLKELPQAVQPGDLIFINDGLIQVKEERIEGEQGSLPCGGRGPSAFEGKGLNLPGIDLGIIGLYRP